LQKKKLRCKSYKKIKRRMNLITQNNKRITFFSSPMPFLRQRERERERERKQKKEKCC